MLLGGAAGLAAWALSLLPPLELADLKGYDLLHALRRSPAPPPEIVIVAIDEPSFSEIGKQWPWPRSLHARLVEALAAEGASVVAFDVLFAEPSMPEEDAALSRSIRSFGRVVLAADIEHLHGKGYDGEMVVEPFGDLLDGASAGIATVPLDPDGVVRRPPSLAEGQRSLAEAVADLYAGKDLRAPEGAWIRYAGPPGTFATVSYYQALSPAEFLSKGFFQDKIVLVGRAVKISPEPGRSGPDLFATPFLFSTESRLMAGVEIHANMIHGLLQGRWVTRLSRGGSLALFVSLAVFAGLVQAGWKPLRSGILTSLCLVLYGAGVCAAFLVLDAWLPTLPAGLCFLLPYGAAGARAYLQSERKRRQIRNMFARYLSPAVLRTVLSRPEDVRLGGHRAEVTVLFTDLAGFTGLAEKLEPEAVGKVLNLYFTEMTRIVFAHKGTIDKFIGDSIMAFWGAPLADDEHAANACRAALAMQARMATLREEMRREGLPELRMRIGIHAGEVTVGNFGSSELYNYTVLGDTVNLASRLEGANKDLGTEILASRAVVERAGSAVRARSLGRICIKGRTEEVEVFELVSAG